MLMVGVAERSCARLWIWSKQVRLPSSTLLEQTPIVRMLGSRKIHEDLYGPYCGKTCGIHRLSLEIIKDVRLPV